MLSTRLDVSKLSARMAAGIEAEIIERAQAMVGEAEVQWQEGAKKAMDQIVEERARELAEAAVPHHVKTALQVLGIPSDVSEDGELTVGEPQPVAEA